VDNSLHYLQSAAFQKRLKRAEGDPVLLLGGQHHFCDFWWGSLRLRGDAAAVFSRMTQPAALHNLFIVNKAGGLIYSRELTPGSRLAGNELLMLASTFHSLHAISKQLAPVASGGIAVVDAPTFSLHCMESPTGVKFFVTARPQTPNVPGFLRKAYELYADYVLKNPFYEIDMPIRVKVRGGSGCLVGWRLFLSLVLAPPSFPCFPTPVRTRAHPFRALHKKNPLSPQTHTAPARRSFLTTTWRPLRALWASPRRRGGRRRRRRQQAAARAGAAAPRGPTEVCAAVAVPAPPGAPRFCSVFRLWKQNIPFFSPLALRGASLLVDPVVWGALSAFLCGAAPLSAKMQRAFHGWRAARPRSSAKRTRSRGGEKEGGAQGAAQEARRRGDIASRIGGSCLRGAIVTMEEPALR